MPQFQVSTPGDTYAVTVAEGAIGSVRACLPERHGKLFIVTTADVWQLHGAKLEAALHGVSYERLLFPGGEDHKRMAEVESLAEQMAERGGDRSSVVVAFGGGIVTDLAGFLAAIFMRGIPVVQIPTTLLAQVDAAVGGKTGSNLVAGKNLVGCFHQPRAVLIDPSVLATLPAREYHAGLFEILKTGVIRSAPLFELLRTRRDAVMAKDAAVVEHIIAESVRIKAEVVSEDEREGGLRRILNFGHTFGHALEAETKYTRFLHGEAVSWGMRAATCLARDLDMIATADSGAIFELLDLYGPIPSVSGIESAALEARLVRDKKTIQKRVHFVLPVRIGEVTVRGDVPEAAVTRAIEFALQDCQ